MQRNLFLAFILASFTLAACSGDMGSGMSTPGGDMPPVQQPMQPGSMMSPTPMTSAGVAQAKITPTPTAPPGNTATYSLAAAANGIRCPQVNGYSCILHVSIATSPSPKPPSKSSASPSPSPTPSASDSPSSSPSPSPSATPAITLQLEAQPHDAPAMEHPGEHTSPSTALVALRMTTNQDVVLKGTESADFIIPSTQMSGRKFAVQLFHEWTGRRRAKVDTFIGSYADSTFMKDALHFTIAAPQVTVKKGETWLFVLYAGEKPTPSPSPSPKPSPTPSPKPSSSPSPSPSPSVSPSTSP
jgi:hypothetical protein